MKRKSICPKCEEPQSRWQCYEPLPGFTNQCTKCGTDYKLSKLSFMIGLFNAFVITGFLILADKNILPWSIALTTSIIIFLTLLYTSPFFTKLEQVDDLKRGIIKKWMLPFFKWQFFICFFIFIPFIFNTWMYLLTSKSNSFNRSYEMKIEEINSVNKLKTVAISYEKLLISTEKMLATSIEMNIMSSIIVIILLMSNFLFYYKIKYIQNKTINSD